MKFVIANRFCFPDESATSRMVSSLAFALQRQGLSMHILASRMDHQQQDVRFLPFEVVHGVNVHRIWTTRFGRKILFGRAIDYLTFYVSAVWWLLRHLRAGDVCVVCTDPPLLSVPVLVPVLLRRAVLINWIMDLFPEIAIKLSAIGRARLAGTLAIGLRDVSLRNARCNVAPIDQMADYLRTRGIPGEKITVLHHWSEGDVLTPISAAESSFRHEWRLDEKFVVAYSGNMGRAHEFHTIIDAASLLRDRSDIVFLFIGDGYWRDWLAQEVEDRGLTNVLFKPLQPRDRLAQSLAVADAHLVSLLPSMEPFIVPSKFFGIAAAGRPTLFIGARNGEIGGLLKSGDCGACIPIGEAELLAEWITRLQENIPLRQAMGRNARRLFDAKFNKARGIAEWRRVLESIVELPDLQRDDDETRELRVSGRRRV